MKTFRSHIVTCFRTHFMSVSGQVTHPGTFGLDAKYGRSLAYCTKYADFNKQI